VITLKDYITCDRSQKRRWMPLNEVGLREWLELQSSARPNDWPANSLPLRLESNWTCTLPSETSVRWLQLKKNNVQISNLVFLCPFQRSLLLGITTLLSWLKSTLLLWYLSNDSPVAQNWPKTNNLITFTTMVEPKFLINLLVINEEYVKWKMLF
jgi:hypothetical protein